VSGNSGSRGRVVGTFHEEGGALTKHFLDHVLRPPGPGLVLPPNNVAFLEFGGRGSPILEAGFAF
jgi:hypothetical protein